MTRGAFWGIAATWEVDSSDAGSAQHLVPAVMVRVTFDGDDRPMWVVCAPGGPPRPLCRHEHLTCASALCSEQEAARAELDRIECVRRIGMLPAPEGARYVAHCGHYWRASAGGACPTCGAPGDALTPAATLKRADACNGWWITTDHVDVRSALADLGLFCGVRVIEHTRALVDRETLKDALPAAIRRLEAAGWRVNLGARKGAA